MKGSRSLIVVVLIAGTLLALKFIFFPPAKKNNAGPSGKPQSSAIPVMAAVLKPSSVTEEIYATGSVLANEEVDLHPEVAGKLMKIHFREGSAVRKGDLLIKINDADLQAELRKNELDHKLAEDRLKRNEKLVMMKGISQEEYDALQNAVASLEAERQLLLARVAKTEIHAPFDGTIGLKSVSEGSYVTPQTVIASLQQIHPAKIDFSVPERYASSISREDEIDFTTGNSRKSYRGTIYAIEPSVDPVTRTVQIRAICPNPHSEIIPGTFARITLELHRLENALMIPTASIIPILKGKQVFVYRSGKAEPVRVETGIRNDSTVQVLSGLSEKDTLIITGMISLRPGTDVKLTSVQ